MTMTRKQMLARIRDRDARYNGVFITGVLSTGIYCLPSCTARRPNEENVRFFHTESEAKEAGLRACKRCRPDLFYRNIDPDENLASELAALIRSNPERFAEVSDLARVSGVGMTKLNLLFRDHYHTTPALYLQHGRARRALLHLLEGASVEESAHLCGYGSSSAYHESIRRFTALSPSEIRRIPETNEFCLRFPKDFRRDLLVRQHTWDGIGPDQKRDGDRVIRALNLPDGPVTLHFRFDEHEVPVRISADRKMTSIEYADILQAMLRMIGLTDDPGPFERKLDRQPQFRTLLEGQRGLRITGVPEPFEGVVWVIVGQAVSVKVAHTIRSRIVEKAGVKAPDGLLAHPAPSQIADWSVDEGMKLGLSRAKTETLLQIARLLAEGELDLRELSLAPSGVVQRTLSNLRGIGPWSVNYLMMRAYGFQDCVPVGDSGLGEALHRFFNLEKRPGKGKTLELMEPFRPYRSLATFHLWMSLGD